MNRPDMLPADPEYRKKVLRFLLLAVLIGFILLSLLVPKLKQAVSNADPLEALALMKIILPVLLIIPALLMIYFIKIAVKTIKQRQFPPLGMQVLRDTPILYERNATKRGIILLILAFAIIDACIFTAVLAIKLLNSLY